MLSDGVWGAMFLIHPQLQIEIKLNDIILVGKCRVHIHDH